MIQEFVDNFFANQKILKEKFLKKHPDNYEEIVRNIIEILHNKNDYGNIDPKRIHLIDDGGYQGILLFIIASSEYQPSDYWYIKVGYGSCSGCDALEGIRNYAETPPTEEQIKDYMTLALHIVQNIKKME